MAKGYYDNRGQWVNYDYANGNRRNNQQGPKKKHSGAKEGITKMTENHKGGKLYVHAWNYSKQRGMVTVSAIENKKSKKYVGKKNQSHFIMMMFEIFYKNSGNKILELASYNTTTGKVFLQKIGMVISTHAPNGGYFGQISNK